MKKTQIIERATVLAGKIRAGRARWESDKYAKSLWKNVMADSVLQLKFTKKYLTEGKVVLAKRALLEAEALYNRYVSR